MKIPFNKPHATGREFEYIREAIEAGHLSGDGRFTRRCHAWLREQTQSHAALLTHSCTAALEMSALLADLEPGDEVILPSYTFVSTANAFVLRRAVPVFVDIRPDTLNLDERLIEEAITPRTRAICAVHYAGVGCEMNALLDITKRRGLMLIEDAAQALLSTWNGKPLGSFGALGCLSFHETKNVISGEGGALLINDPALAHRAEVLREKGTNRSAFFRGEVDKYTWVDHGSSYLPSEILAAFLWAQLEHAKAITDTRRALWRRYHENLAAAEARGLLSRPVVPAHCEHNAHMYYVLTRSLSARTTLIAALKEAGFHAVFHYVPLHSAPAGRKYGRAVGAMDVTASVSDRLLRLPLWVDLDPAQVDAICTLVTDVLSRT